MTAHSSHLRLCRHCNHGKRPLLARRDPSSNSDSANVVGTFGSGQSRSRTGQRDRHEQRQIAAAGSRGAGGYGSRGSRESSAGDTVACKALWLSSGRASGAARAAPTTYLMATRLSSSLRNDVSGPDLLTGCIQRLLRRRVKLSFGSRLPHSLQHRRQIRCSGTLMVWASYNGFGFQT